MHENTLQEDSGVWLILYRLALALICSLTALNIGVLLLAIRRERKVLLGAASPRAFLLERPRAFLYLCCGHRITVIIPAIVLSVLANFNFDFRLYVINLGIYASLSGERLFWIRMWTNPWAKCKLAGAIICDGLVLGLLVGSVPLAQLYPTAVKVMSLLTISGCRLWSALEVWAVLQVYRDTRYTSISETQRDAQRWCVLMLALMLLHITVWFAMVIGQFSWFSLVVYLSCIPSEGFLYARQIWALYLREQWLGWWESLSDASELQERPANRSDKEAVGVMRPPAQAGSHQEGIGKLEWKVDSES